MAARESFTAPVAGGALRGWVEGDGPPVVLLHGGPGMSFDYLDGLRAELDGGVRVAAYQQRGLAPSTTEGPFSIAQELADFAAVLDALEWRRAFVVGHSWGGQLALRVAAAHPDRVLGALAVDPLGIVGDGGYAAFEAEMVARTPKEDRERGHELDERAMAGEGSEEDAVESLRLMWPAYFADPRAAPPMPAMHICIDAYAGIMEQRTEGLDEVVAALAGGDVRYGVLAGAASPMPWGQAARASAEVSSSAFLELVPAAGHFPWLEVPGCVRDALRRLME